MGSEQRFVVVYTKAWCPFCVRVKALLDQKGVEYEEIDLEEHPELIDEVQRKSGRMTVPQVFVGEEPLGGYDEVAALDRAGDLDGKLGL
jgi:glutaredoxin 3